MNKTVELYLKVVVKEEGNCSPLCPFYIEEESAPWAKSSRYRAMCRLFGELGNIKAYTRSVACKAMETRQDIDSELITNLITENTELKAELNAIKDNWIQSRRIRE